MASPSTTRVTITSRLYLPEGGAAAYRLAALARALEASGAQVTVLTTRPPDGTRTQGRVRRWPVLRDRSGAVRGYLQYASFDLPLLFRLLFSARADVVVSEPPPTTGVIVRVVCAIRRIPYVYYSADVTSAALGAIRVNPLIAAGVRAMERWVLGGAAAILTVSDAVKDELVALGATPERVHVTGVGVDTDAFSPDGPVLAGEAPYLVYAGTMSEVHGAGIFVDAFAQVVAAHPTARLEFFGGGVDADALAARAAEISDRIRFHGLVDAAVLTPWLRGSAAALASVRPGAGYDFAYATKAFAATACGTPVLFSGVGPLREIVRDHALGWSVDWDTAEVAAAMGAALTGGPRRSTALAAWTDEHHSLRAVATRAAAAVLAARERRPETLAAHDDVAAIA